jgi:hypothetical protein
MSTLLNQALIDEIEAAFASTPRPSGPLFATIQHDGEDEYFEGKTWQECRNVRELRENEAALCYFTSEAFRYFLPAFMIAYVVDPDGADIIEEGIVTCFDPSNPRLEACARERAQLLSDSERKAVCDFMLHLKAETGGSLDFVLGPALNNVAAAGRGARA